MRFAVWPFVALVLVAIVLIALRKTTKRPSLSAICPKCGSKNIAPDAHSPWVFVGAAILFPFGLIFFASNRNRWCRDCGVRFKVLEGE